MNKCIYTGLAVFFSSLVYFSHFIFSLIAKAASLVCNIVFGYFVGRNFIEALRCHHMEMGFRNDISNNTFWRVRCVCVCARTYPHSIYFDVFAHFSQSKLTSIIGHFCCNQLINHKILRRFASTENKTTPITTATATISFICFFFVQFDFGR